MKSKKIIIISVAVILVLAIVISAGCLIPSFIKENKMHSYAQEINLEESTATINNPDQGFYRPIYVKMNEEGASYNKNIVTGSTMLYHLRIDISAFSSKVNGTEDKTFNQEALVGFEEMLEYLKSKNKNAIVRFAYDPSFGGSANKEPDLEIMLEHIKQVCPILNNFENTITAVEAGLIGPWGEMHTSTIAKTAIKPIVEKFLSETINLPILVRTPKMIYNYLGITIDDIDDYEIESNPKAYRLGLYNDGYLGSSNDLGTYTNREKEIAFLSKQTGHLPYGGEVVVPGSILHNIENCLPEMFQLNLNYLNIEWNNEVINKWKNTYYTSECGEDENYYGRSAFDYINNHVGYRFLLTQSTFEYSNRFNKLKVKLKFNNVGFGNLNKTKKAKLVFVDENNEIKYAENVGAFSGGGEVNYSSKLKLENGRYEVYLSIYGEEFDGKDLYGLQFANCDIWNGDLNANKIGEINIQK